MARSARATVEAFCDALARADAQLLAAELTDDAVMHGTVGGIDEGRVFRGRQAIVAYFAEIGAAWESLDVSFDAIYIEGDAGLVLMRETARSSQSSVPIETATASLCRVRDGKVAELRGYMDREAALLVFRGGAVA